MRKTKKKTDDHAESVIDFAWILYIAIKKLGLSRKEAGRLKMYEFSQMYRSYKEDFDLEMKMYRAGICYSSLSGESEDDYSEEVINF